MNTIFLFPISIIACGSVAAGQTSESDALLAQLAEAHRPRQAFFFTMHERLERAVVPEPLIPCDRPPLPHELPFSITVSEIGEVFAEKVHPAFKKVRGASGRWMLREDGSYMEGEAGMATMSASNMGDWAAYYIATMPCAGFYVGRFGPDREGVVAVVEGEEIVVRWSPTFTMWFFNEDKRLLRYASTATNAYAGEVRCWEETEFFDAPAPTLVVAKSAPEGVEMHDTRYISRPVAAPSAARERVFDPRTHFRSVTDYKTGAMIIGDEPAEARESAAAEAQHTDAGVLHHETRIQDGKIVTLPRKPSWISALRWSGVGVALVGAIVWGIRRVRRGG